MKKNLLLFLAFASVSLSATSNSRADILTTAYFTGQILRYNDSSNSFSTFATIDPGVDVFPGLSGIAVDSVGNRVYASARESSRIYEFNATTGAPLGFQQLSGIVPTGIAFNGGKLYVANNGGNSVEVYGSGLAFERTIDLPDFDPGLPGIQNNFPSGVGVTADNRLLVSTFAGGGVYSHDLISNVTGTFSNLNPVANAQISIAPDGSVYVGGAAFSSSTFRFDTNGNPIGTISVGNAVLPQPSLPYVSPDFTSPSGIAMDPDGNLIVSALGRTNPFNGPSDLAQFGQINGTDNFQSNGGLFKFSQTGILLQTYGTNLTPLSSAAFISAVPEPSSFVLLSVVVGGLLWRSQSRFLNAGPRE